MNTWDVVKTVGGAFIIVYALQGGWHLAKSLGRKEALEEIENQPHVEPGRKGEPIIVGMDGKKFRIIFEEVKG